MNTSIILCTYNGSKYIKELIQSLKLQVDGFDEIVICDDNSKDDTITIISDLLDEEIRNGKAKIFINANSLGAYGNFINACSLASGDLLFFCDQDDIWINDKVSCMKNIMAANSRINVLAANLKPLYEGRTGLKARIALEHQVNNENLVFVDCKAENIATRRSGCTMCIRREYYNKIRPLWIENWAHDDFFWKMAVNEGSLAIINHLSVLRRVHGNNTSINVNRSRKNRIDQIKTEINHSLIAINHTSNDSEIATKQYIDFLKMRIHNLDKPSLYYFFKILVNNKNLFRSKSQIIMDLYLTINRKL